MKFSEMVVPALRSVEVVRFGDLTNPVPPSTGWHILPINRYYGNTIPGCTFGSNQYILPPGRYLWEMAGGPVRSDAHFFSMYDVGKSTYLDITPDEGSTNYDPYFANRNDDADGIGRDQSLCFCNLEHNRTQTFENRVYFQTRNTSSRLGQTSTQNTIGCTYWCQIYRLGDY